MSAQRRPTRAAARFLPAPSSINWPWFALALAFCAYWLFVSSLERIDANEILAGFFVPNLSSNQMATVTFSPWVTMLVELFHPRVLRHFIPLFVGWWLAKQAAISLMQVLYNCPDRRTAAEFLRRQRRNRASRSEVPYVVTPQNLAEDREKVIMLGVGGPVWVQVPNGHAAVTERNARFLRVIPPGVHELGRFEYIQNVIDLQPQERTAADVVMLTKEGIPLHVDLGLTFRIDPGNTPASPNRPYPYNEEAVRRAAYAGGVGAGGKVSSWVEGPLGKARGELSKFVSTHALDELVAAESPRDAQYLLVNNVTTEVWKKLQEEHIKPLRLRVSRLTPPPEVSRQYTDYWLATRRKEDLLARANGTANLLEEIETARAAAEIAMVQAIVDGIRHAQQEAGSNLSGYLLALRLMEALRNMVQFSSASLESLGGETDHLIEEIESVDYKLADMQDQLKLPQPTFKPSSPD